MRHHTRRGLLKAGLSGMVVSSGCTRLMGRDQGRRDRHVTDIDVICDAPLPASDGTGGHWKTYHHDIRNTGHAPNVTGPTGCPEVAWHYDSGDYIFGQPTFDGKHIFLSGGGGQLYAIRPQTGQQVWTHSGTYVPPHTPITHNGRVYRSNNQYIQVFTDGRLKSKLVVGGNSAKRIQITDQCAYIADPGGRFFALDLQSGQTEWIYTESGINPGQFDVTDNSTEARRYRDGAFTTPAAVGNTLVFAGSWDTRLYAFRRDTGTIVWTADFPHAFDVSAPVLRHGRLFATDGSVLRCLDPTTGNVLWERTEGTFGPTPVVTDTELIICHTNPEPTLTAYAWQTGDEIWQTKIPQNPRFLAVAGEVIYTRSGTEIAYRRKDGRRLLRVSGLVRGPSVVGGGTLLFPRPDRLRAIR